MRVGKPISVSDQEAYPEIPQFYEFIRKKTYMLANPFEKNKNILSAQNLKIPKPAKKITSQKNVDFFVKEVNALRDNNKRLSSTSPVCPLYARHSQQE